MPKAILEGRTKEQRAEQRKNLGSLRSLTVQPKTKKRYDLAMEKFFSFLAFEKLTLPKQRSQMDDLVSDYLEHLWSSGEERALASDTVAALQNTEPHLKGQLLGSWRLLKYGANKKFPIGHLPCLRLSSMPWLEEPSCIMITVLLSPYYSVSMQCFVLVNCLAS